MANTVTKYPERSEVRLPKGTHARIDRVLGVDPADARSGQGIRGHCLRRWLLERLEREETELGNKLDGAAACAAVLPSGNSDGRRRALLDMTASLLGDADETVRRRIESYILIAQDLQRRRRVAGGS